MSNKQSISAFDQACSWRRRAIEALEAAAIDYRVVFSSASVAGVRAGIRAGLAIGTLGASTATDDLARVTGPAAPPALPPAELVLLRGEGLAPATDELAECACREVARGL